MTRCSLLFAHGSLALLIGLGCGTAQDTALVPASAGEAVEVVVETGANQAATGPVTIDTRLTCEIPDITCDTASEDLLVNKDTITLKFEGLSAGQTTEVGGFVCAFDEESFAPCSSPVELEDIEDRRHTFRVSAKDKGRRADPSPAKFSWTVDTVVPDTKIDRPPPRYTAKTSAKFEFSADDLTALFECKLDGGGWAACASPADFSNLGEGNHTLEIRALDAAGNKDASPSTYLWTIDLTPPDASIAASDTKSFTTGNTISFTLLATENGKPSSDVFYECGLEPDPFAPCLNPRSYSSLSDGKRTFKVRAIDLVGNVDDSPATYSWTIDTIAPETTIEAKAQTPPSLTSGTSATFGFKCEDLSSPCTFWCRLDSSDSTQYQSCPLPPQAGEPDPPPPVIAYTGLADGSHKFEVHSIDQAGNRDLSNASYTWMIDSTQPQTTITSSVPPFDESSATLMFACTDVSTCTFECALDPPAPPLATIWTSCLPPATYALSNAAHTFYVRATDAVGNRDDTPASLSWTTAAPPDTTITSTNISPYTTVTTNTTFSFSSTISLSSFDCRLDSGAWGTCGSPKTYPGALAQGVHVFEVRAVKDGIVDPSPAIYTWTIDTGIPDTQIDTNPTDPSSASVQFTFSGTDPAPATVLTFECQLDAGTFVPCSSPMIYSGLSGGDHIFKVRAKDAAGNLDPSPASHGDAPPGEWTVDAVNPDTQIAVCPSTPTNSTSAIVSFSELGGPDASQPVTFECKLDTGTYGVCASPKNYASLSDGQHVFNVRAKDAVGNYDLTPASCTWTIDTAPPDTTIGTKPSDPSTSSTANFTFTSPDATATFECRETEDIPYNYAPCTTPKQYTLLSDGAHTFDVRALDGAGNVDASAATYSWTIDTVPPTAPSGLGAAAISGSQIDLTWTDNSADEAGFDVLRKAGAAAGSCTDASYSVINSPAANTVAYSNTGLTPNTQYSYCIKARDAGGNASFSNQSTATTTGDITPPTFPPPGGLTSLTALSDTSVKLAWTAATDDVTAGGLIVYEICQNAATGGCAGAWTANYSTTGCSPGPTSCAYTVIGLTAGSSYFFVVRAKDEAGNQDVNAVEKKRTFLTNGGFAEPGGWHTCARITDSTVRCWGENTFGQLGNGLSGSANDSQTAVQVSVLNTAASAGAGGWHSCAPISDNTVQCWGYNSDGQLGDNTTINKSIPTAVSTMATATAIAVGRSHSCALLATNTVQCWGVNSGGQLGDGSSANKAIPVTVSVINTATAISAGEYHTCALLADASVQCWGRNDLGQVGDGTTTNRLFPVTVTSLTNVSDLGTGGWHSCARITDSTARCWGRNAEGQLGDGTTTNRLLPTAMSGIATANAVTAGGWHTCVLLADATVRCQGSNAKGAVGDGTTVNRTVPTIVTSLTNVSSVEAGLSHVCAVKTDNTVHCWGDNAKGQTGRGFGSFNITPQPVMVQP